MPTVSAPALSVLPGLRTRFLVASAFGVAVFLAIPLLSILASVFAPGGQAWDHLMATVLPGYVKNSLWLCLWVAIGTGLVGVGAAWLVTSCQFPGRAALEWALVLPLAMPAYVVAYAYTDLLQFSGPAQTALREAFGWSRADYWFPDVRSLGGAAAMFVCVLYPYVYLLARVAFLDQSASLAEAGRTLGLSAWKSFFRLSLPLARPAIVAGVALALMETLADFGTVAYFGVQTFTTGIYRAWLSMGEPVSAAKLSLWLLAFVMVVLALERGSRRGARFYETPSPKQRVRAALSGPRAIAATALCLLPLVAGFLLPLALLVRMSIGGGDEQFGSRFITLAANSFQLAAITAGIAVLLALLMAYGARLARSRVASTVNRFVALGYAVPGSVIAVGVLIPASRIDHFIADLHRRRPGPHRKHRRAGLCLPRALPGGGAANGGGGTRQDHAQHGGRGAIAGTGCHGNAGARACAIAQAQPRHRRPAGVRRRDEGVACDVRDAPIQLRHACRAGLQPRRG